MHVAPRENLIISNIGIQPLSAQISAGHAMKIGDQNILAEKSAPCADCSPREPGKPRERLF
jgi:hypothetical protein